VVEANVIHGNGCTGGSSINGDGVQGSRIVNNIRRAAATSVVVR
jgi:hypothetical protein